MADAPPVTTSPVPPRPLIAVVGSASPDRVKELGLTSVEMASLAGEQLGVALARKGCHIVVYDSGAGYLERDVVRGYAQVAEADDSIQVRFSTKHGRPMFAEEQTQGRLFAFRPDPSPEWERAFYHSLGEVDGIILLGGGSSTLIAGLVAHSHRKAIACCATFGGAAQKVWATLSERSTFLTEADVWLMGNSWKEGLAEKLVNSLMLQIERKAKERDQKVRQEIARIEQAREEERRSLREQQKREASVTSHTIVAVLLFAAALATWVITRAVDGLPSWAYMALLVIAPVLAGTSGATIRVVTEALQGRPLMLHPLAQTAGAGFVAGGISGVLFTIAPSLAAPGSSTTDFAQLRGLVPFVMMIGFIGGITLDAVFERLRKVDATKREALGSLTETR